MPESTGFKRATSSRIFWVIVAVLGQISFGVCQSSEVSTEPKLIDSSEDVLSEWQSHQRLYVKGDLGVGDSQLAGLEQWLDQNGTNWIVLLMDTAEGERFTDASGRSFRNMDAVEHRLGKGLPGQTDFGTWTDSRTGERSGAFFVLFLKERKFSYFGSDVYDKRSLGENRWKGRLDKPAIAAMRGGGRVVDAAKDTVASIDKQLTQKITAAERIVRQALAKEAARKERLRTKATTSLRSVREQLIVLTNRVKALTAEHPEMTGDLVQIDFAGWEAQLASADASLVDQNYDVVIGLANEVNRGVQHASDHLDAHQVAVSRINDLESELQRWRNRQYAGQIEERFFAAENALNQTRELHASAELNYLKELERAKAEVRSIADHIRRQTRNAEAQREVLLFVGSSTVVVFTVLAVFMNRRRCVTRLESFELIDAWKRALDEKRVSASTLMHRSMESLGVTQLEAEARFSGTTLQLVEQTIRDVDEMVIMANCASRVLRDADQLARPGRFLAKFTNMFFKRRYLHALRRLRDQPISFSPEEGLTRVMEKKRTDRDKLLGELESYQPFQLSFNELIENFNERAERAFENLGQLERGQLKIADLLINVKRRIDETQSLAMKLDTNDSDHEWFSVSEVLSNLLPSAASDYSEAAVISIKDPLGALNGNGKRAQEQSDDAHQAVDFSTEFESRILPELQSAEKKLIELRLSIDWIDAALYERSDEFETTIAMSVEDDQSVSIGRIDSETNELLDLAVNIVEAEKKRVNEVVAGIADATELVETTRIDLSGKLNLSPEEMLIETGRNPDDNLRIAGQQSAAARAAANRGDLDATKSSINAALREIDLVGNLIEATRTAFSEHDGILGLRKAEDDRLQKEVPVHENILGEIESGYAASVLLLNAGDPSHPDANGTIRDNISEISELMLSAKENIEFSIQWYASGRILDSAIALEQADLDQQLGKFRLREIREKKDRLEQFEKENRSLLELLLTRIGHLKALAADKRTMRPSQENVRRIKRVSEEFTERIETSVGDPFKFATELKHLKGEIDNVEIVIQSDWREHAEVIRSIEIAQDQLGNLGKLETRSASDNHPDSLLTREIIEEARKLREQLPRLRARSEEAHGDWDELDDHVDNLARQAGLLAARLRKDLEAAEKAYSELRSAMNSVRSASRWSGGYGVSLASRYGAETLTQARQGFQRGDYSTVISAALLAKRLATQAIAEAEAEVRRRRQAEQQRIQREQRRRAAAARRAARSVSRSSFGSSSGSSRSSFGSSSGSSRSSFSSGSGTSRSGW